MAQYKQTEITNVYWASNEGFKGGRDPLGIQNSSIATYSKLLPGLTNLTSHIRYYSLYCWLLSEYDELEKAKKTTLHQYNFIRRAELAMALIMKDQGVGRLLGHCSSHKVDISSKKMEFMILLMELIMNQMINIGLLGVELWDSIILAL